MNSLGRMARVAAGTAVLFCATAAIASPTRVDQLVRNALQLEPNASHGAALYLQNCARCHGQGAIGVGDEYKVVTRPMALGELQSGKGGCVSGGEVVSGRGKGFVHGPRLQFVSRPAALRCMAGRRPFVAGCTSFRGWLHVVSSPAGRKS